MSKRNKFINGVVKYKMQILSTGVMMMLSLTVMGTTSEVTTKYEVYDEGNVQTVYTTSNNYREVLNELGYDPNDYEVTTHTLADANVKSLILEEKFEISVDVDNETISYATAGATVAEVLDDLNITLSENDEISHDLNATVSEGTKIVIVRVETQTEEVTEEVAYETERIPTLDLKDGETRTVTEGENGEAIRTYEILYKDGVEFSRNIIEEEMTKDVVNEVIEYGAGGNVVTVNGEIINYSKKLNVVATAYSTEGWTSKNTASGTVARVGAIAVDPNTIPLGSKMYITSADGTSWVYGYAVAEDTGGSIDGNRIDLFFNTQYECIQFGVKDAIVYVLK